jgi:hypothetical protein
MSNTLRYPWIGNFVNVPYSRSRITKSISPICDIIPKMIKHYWEQLIHTPKWLIALLLVATLVRLWLISQWNINVISLVLSLVLVILTWFFAASLADGAHLSSRGKERFMVMSSLVAAMPPLNSIVQELNIIFCASLVIVLLLLFYAYMMLQRWLSQQNGGKGMSRRIFQQLFQLTCIPILFGISGNLIGYFNETLLIVLPFLLAALFSIPYMVTQYQAEVSGRAKQAASRVQISVVFHVFMLVLIALYFILHIYSYITHHMILLI